ADTLRRRLRDDQLGMLCLEFGQLAQERVVGLVRDRWLIEDVVLIVRLLDALPEVCDAPLGCGGGHASIVGPNCDNRPVPAPPVTDIDLLEFAEIVDNARADLNTGLVATSNDGMPDLSMR